MPRAHAAEDTPVNPAPTTAILPRGLGRGSALLGGFYDASSVLAFCRGKVSGTYWLEHQDDEYLQNNIQDLQSQIEEPERGEDMAEPSFPGIISRAFDVGAGSGRYRPSQVMQDAHGCSLRMIGGAGASPLGFVCTLFRREGSMCYSEPEVTSDQTLVVVQKSMRERGPEKSGEQYVPSNWIAGRRGQRCTRRRRV
jgi:hypothetical protein